MGQSRSSYPFTRHAADRMWDRYGIRLNRWIASQIREQIRAGLSPSSREGLSLPIYTVTVDDGLGPSVTVPVSYDLDTDTIVTVLPPQ